MNKFMRIRETQIYELNNNARLWIGSLNVDADGCPTAYHPDNCGLDYLANAGEPGNWYGIACDSDGDPFLQDSGYYISTTALEDPTYPPDDPKRYCDASAIPYIVLPGSKPRIANLADYAFVKNLSNGKSSFAICGDIGPDNEIGEGSIELVRSLGVEPVVNNRVRQGIDSNVLTIVFPHSRQTRWHSTELKSDIEAAAHKIFSDWGGYARVEQLLTSLQDN